MDIKANALLAVSLSALFLASCTTTDGRFTTGQQATTTVNGQAGVKHTHNGVAHTHPLPDGGLSHSHNYNSGAATNTCAPCTAGTTRTPVVNIPVSNTGNAGGNGNSHVHDGRRHSHPLPASGTNHQHRQGGGNVVTQPQQQSQPQPQPQQPANTTYYDYSGGSSSTGSSYYNYGGSKGNAANNNVSHAHNGRNHSHALPASGTNHTHQGDTSFNGSNVGGGDGSSNANVYVVKPKDTVFQVMRNTGVYWKTIIKLNNLQAPDYTISPGQRLKLK